MTGERKWPKQISWVIQKVKKGPQECSALRNKFKGDNIGSEKNFYRCISALKDAEVIETESGYYKWYKNAKVEYSTSAEYESHLEHSKRLFNKFNSMKDKLKSSNLELGFPKGRKENKIYIGALRSHVKSGYPSIYEQYKDLRQENKQYKNKESDFKQFIKRRIEKELPDNINTEDLSDALCLILRRKIADSPINCSKLKKKDGRITFGDKDLGDSDNYEEIKTFISHQVDDEEAVKKAKSVEESFLASQSLAFGLRSELEKLQMEVANGNPLKGRCELCPDFRIKKNEERFS